MPGMEVLQGLENTEEQILPQPPQVWGSRNATPTIYLLSGLGPGCGWLWLISASWALPSSLLFLLGTCCVPAQALPSASAEPAELPNVIGSVGSAQEGRSSPCLPPHGDPRLWQSQYRGKQVRSAPPFSPGRAGLGGEQEG